MQKSHSMSARITVSALLSILVLAVCMGIGSVEIPVSGAMTIIADRISGKVLPSSVDPAVASILWKTAASAAAPQKSSASCCR